MNFNLEEATIDTIHELMLSGKLTAKKLTMYYLARIAKIDKQGVKINSVLEINPDALHIAEALDARLGESGLTGPLHGIPILLKDNIDTKDKLHTSAGSLALSNHRARQDSFVARRLRDAGAIILGKANMTEWANFMSDRMPNGYSSRGGQVQNPYGPGVLDVGGSSSGSGAAVAANLTMAAIGTETSGSILSPASENSVVGIKPTVGLISRSGIVPISNSQDTAGPLARTVKDAAIVLGTLTGWDPTDAATGTAQDKTFQDYTQFCKNGALKGARLGIARKPYLDNLDSECQGLIDEALAVLRESGAVVIELTDYPPEQGDWNYNVLIYEFKVNLNAYLSQVGADVCVHSLSELIRFNKDKADIMLRYGQSLLLASEETSGTLTEPAYLETRLQDVRYGQELGIDRAIQVHKLDALLFPANLGAGIPAKAGYPSICVPCGYGKLGKPLGLTFTGTAFSEPKLIALAYSFEQSTKHRVSPRLGLIT